MLIQAYYFISCGFGFVILDGITVVLLELSKIISVQKVEFGRQKMEVLDQFKIKIHLLPSDIPFLEVPN